MTRSVHALFVLLCFLVVGHIGLSNVVIVDVVEGKTREKQRGEDDALVDMSGESAVIGQFHSLYLLCSCPDKKVSITARDRKLLSLQETLSEHKR